MRWVRAGHRVTVITCAPNVPDGVVYEGYRNRFRPQHETVDGVEVIRVWTYLAANAGGAKRILNFVSYMVSAVLASVVCCRRPDVIVATSPQFFCGWAGVGASYLLRLKRRRGRGGPKLAGEHAFREMGGGRSEMERSPHPSPLPRAGEGARRWRVPFVLEIRDIWPESIVTVGAMRPGRLVRLLEWMERWMYLSADHVVAVGEGYKQKVLEKADVADRISVVTNGVDLEQFTPRKKSEQFLRCQGLEDRFVCSYVGTIGMAHGLETVLDAADRLRNAGRTDIAFCLVGDGAERGRLQQACHDRDLQSMVKFTGRLPKSEISTVLASSDAILIHLKKCDLFETVIPSKIFEAMAMNRPLIMGVQGESAAIVERSQSGIHIEPGNPEQMVDVLRRLADDPRLYRQLCAHGRQFVAAHYTRDVLAGQYLQLIKSIANGKPVPVEVGSPAGDELACEDAIARK